MNSCDSLRPSGLTTTERKPVIQNSSASFEKGTAQPDITGPIIDLYIPSTVKRRDRIIFSDIPAGSPAGSPGLPVHAALASHAATEKKTIRVVI